jgi:hypothetical protein
MDYVYKPCIAELKSKAQLFIDNGVIPIAHFDKFKGQYIHPDLHQPYAKPAAFFKFNITWEDLVANAKKGHATLEVHLELENYYESGDINPDKDLALLDYEMIRVTSAILHGFKTANFSALRHKSTDEDESPTTTNVTIMRFEFDVIDESTTKIFDIQKLDDMTLKQKPEDDTPPAVEDDDVYII